MNVEEPQPESDPAHAAAPPAAQVTAPAAGRSSPVAHLLTCLAVALVIAGLGAPLGLLWAAVAPNVRLQQTEYGPYPVDGQPEGYVADEGWFLGIAVVAGAALAIITWFALRRYRGPLILAALVSGSIGGSVLAAWIGHRVGLAEYERLVREAAPGTTILRPVRLRTADVGLFFGWIPRVRGSVLVQAIVAAGLYTLLAGFHDRPSLRPGEDDDEPVPVSWDWPGPQDPTAAPAPHEPASAVPPPGAAAPARPATD